MGGGDVCRFPPEDEASFASSPEPASSSAVLCRASKPFSLVGVFNADPAPQFAVMLLCKSVIGPSGESMSVATLRSLGVTEKNATKISQGKKKKARRGVGIKWAEVDKGEDDDRAVEGGTRGERRQE